MVFTVVFATLFLVAFAVIAGVVMYLSKTIDHGEARFDSNGKIIKGNQQPSDPVKPAKRIDKSDSANQVKNDD